MIKYLLILLTIVTSGLCVLLLAHDSPQVLGRATTRTTNFELRPIKPSPAYAPATPTLNKEETPALETDQTNQKAEPVNTASENNTPLNKPNIKQKTNLSAPVIESLVNEWRSSVNLAEYSQSPITCEFAERRLDDINADWSHDGFNQLSNILTQKYYPNRTQPVYFAENLALGWQTEKEILSAWLNSPTHKRNLTSDYPFMCIRVAGNIVIQIFSNT